MESIDRQLRYFLRVAELRSLSKAADALDLTQSGISRQIAALEAHLGKSLFVRTGRGVELTPAGEKLQAVAKPSYLAIDEALASIRVKEGVTEGRVRLAAVHTLTYYFLADVVAEFVTGRENVNLSLMGRSSPEVVNAVESGRADVGFVYDTAMDSPDISAETLFEEEMCLISLADRSVECGVDLAASPCRLVGFPADFALRRMLQSTGLSLNFVAEADTVDGMLRLVSSGVGACVLPSHLPDRLLAESNLTKTRIISPRLRRRVVAITRSDRTRTALVEDLIEIARRRSTSIQA